MTVARDTLVRAQPGVCPPSALPLEDRFEILKDIGDGSFGSVVLARVRTAGATVARRGTIVAIKTMKKTFESFAPCLELREVVFLRNLPQHSHLVPAYDIFLDPFSKRLHICMEYMDGNLYQLMKARDRKCLDNLSVKSILFQIMNGLEHIHAHHFFHRDIKPENILVSTSSHQDAGTFRRYSGLVTPPHTPPAYTVKIADFGLARETHSKLPYTTYVSTRWYRAPEVLLRAGEYSAPVDIWAVGAMAVEIATLKPLFPGGNEVEQVWRVCEIMGSPGNWFNKAGARVGGGEWRDGTRLAGKLGFSFPKMAPHSIDSLLPFPQWPASLSQFVTCCLMWDPKSRPTSTQALAHDYFTDAVDPLRPKSSTSKVLGRKQSDLTRRDSRETSVPIPPSTTLPPAKPSWFRKSLIGRTEPAIILPDATVTITSATVTIPGALLPDHQSLVTSSGARPAPVHSVATAESQSKSKPRPIAAKRSTWASGLSGVAQIPILPTIRPITPLSHAVSAEAKAVTQRNQYTHRSLQQKAVMAEEKVGRRSGLPLPLTATVPYTELHRQQAERTLNGNATSAGLVAQSNSGLVSPPSAHRESFFAHLRKKARRFSGRHQTPISPAYEEADGCGQWPSARSSMVVENQAQQAHAWPSKLDGYESVDHGILGATGSHLLSAQPNEGSPNNSLKRHHSVSKQQQQWLPSDHLGMPPANRAPALTPLNSRIRRTQASQTISLYKAPDEEDELLDEVLNSTRHVIKRLEKGHDKPSLRTSMSNVTLPHPYPTPSPSANGHMMFNASHNDLHSSIPRTLELPKRSVVINDNYTWPTPPYEESEWAASASASIWAAGNRL